MSTIYQITEPAVATAALQPGDRIPVYNTSTGRTVSMTGSLLAAGSPAPVAVTAGATTLTVTQAAHANRLVVLSNTAPIAITLPQATGTGDKYTFVTRVAATGTTSSIKVANATDVMQGMVVALSTASDAMIGFKTSATSDTIALNGTTLGGVADDVIEITDIATGFFSVIMFTRPTGTYATPFSATVS